MRKEPEEMGLTLAYSAPAGVPAEEAEDVADRVAPTDGELIQRVADRDESVDRARREPAREDLQDDRHSRAL